jgi:flap endonuclease-1
MGVKGLNQVINMYAKSCTTVKKFRDYNGSVQSLDAAITIYKFCIATIGTDHFKTEGVLTGHLFACFFKTISMLRYGIFPIWVFDGKPPHIKIDTLVDRKKRKLDASEKLSSTPDLDDYEKNKLERRAFTVTHEHITEVKYLLTLLGIPFIESPGEAEAQCAAFDRANISNGVVTEDWDVILFGCKKMLRDFSNKNDVTEIDTDELLNNLGMTQV